MNRKEIVILIVVFVSILLLSTFSVYFLLRSDHSEKPKKRDTLTLENYSLKYGNYIGYEREYNYENNKTEKKKITVTLTEEKINDESYSVKGNKIYVNGFEMYEVTANNKMTLLAGEGVELKYEG